jgi:hypothetical protein
MICEQVCAGLSKAFMNQSLRGRPWVMMLGCRNRPASGTLGQHKQHLKNAVTVEG